MKELFFYRWDWVHQVEPIFATAPSRLGKGQFGDAGGRNPGRSCREDVAPSPWPPPHPPHALTTAGRLAAALCEACWLTARRG